jgi:hypothetical protein
LQGAIPPHLRTARLADGEIVIADHHRGAALFGPYCTLPAGHYRATLWVQATVPESRQKPWSVEIDVCSAMAEQVHAVRAIDRVELADRWFEPLEIEFHLAAPASKMEVRLHASGLTALAIRRGIDIRML